MVFYACMSATAQHFCIASKGKTATIIVDENDWKGVILSLIHI